MGRHHLNLGTPRGWRASSSRSHHPSWAGPRPDWTMAANLPARCVPGSPGEALSATSASCESTLQSPASQPACRCASARWQLEPALSTTDAPRLDPPSRRTPRPRPPPRRVASALSRAETPPRPRAYRSARALSPMRPRRCGAAWVLATARDGALRPRQAWRSRTCGKRERAAHPPMLDSLAAVCRRGRFAGAARAREAWRSKLQARPRRPCSRSRSTFTGREPLCCPRQLRY